MSGPEDNDPVDGADVERESDDSASHDESYGDGADYHDSGSWSVND